MDNSIWSYTKLPHFEAQSGNINCDVLIVGGGLCGLVCAFELAESGVDPQNIVLIDAHRLFSGSSVRATAKLTSQHGIIYQDVSGKFGQDAAKQYADANEKAIRRAFEIAEKLSIGDAITPRTACLYAKNEQELLKLQKEQLAASKAGIKCEITRECELPFDVKGVLAFFDQAAINPSLYALAIINYLSDKGCRIYENTAALSIENDAVITDKGKIFAKKTVISTRFPFVDKRGLYFVKLYQQRAYLLAVEGAPKLNNMYIGIGQDSLTFRQAGDLLIFGGKASRNGNSYSQFFELIGIASELFPGCGVVEKWSNEDVITHDRIPYIGVNEHIPGTYIASGFGMWGMSTSFAAGKMLSDLITHGFCENSALFSPSRSVAKAGKRSFFINAAEIAGEFAQVLDVPDKSLAQIERGEGCIAAAGKRKLGAYRGNDGRLRLVVPTCSHMKCALRWNREEHCWDCPCHGSRFDTNGDVISGPAMKSIKFYNKSKTIE